MKVDFIDPEHWFHAVGRRFHLDQILSTSVAPEALVLLGDDCHELKILPFIMFVMPGFPVPHPFRHTRVLSFKNLVCVQGRQTDLMSLCISFDDAEFVAWVVKRDTPDPPPS